MQGHCICGKRGDVDENWLTIHVTLSGHHSGRTSWSVCSWACLIDLGKREQAARKA